MQHDLADYVSAQADRVRLAASRAGRRVVQGAVAATLLAAAAITAIVLFLLGLAGAVAAAADRPWLGNLVIGGGVLALLAIAASVRGARARAARWRRLRRRYEGRDEADTGAKEADAGRS